MPNVCTPVPLSLQVEELRVKLRDFKASLPEYPADRFSGRGVVMIAGGLKYMVSEGLPVLTAADLLLEFWKGKSM
jgi:hypothetical protein